MKSQTGFTLLELLVSLTLVGLLFVLLFGGLRFGMRAWERGSSTTDASDTIRTVQDLVRGEVEHACPRRLAATAPPPAPSPLDFSGGAVRLRFLGPAPQAAGGRSCARLTLQVLPDGTLQRLVLKLGSNPGTDLLRHAQAIDFAYLAAGGAWRGGWSGQSALPALVRLRIAFPAGDARLWPELFLSPRISAEADCTYDAATKSCRDR
jgi:general secretion pathway protein J